MERHRSAEGSAPWLASRALADKETAGVWLLTYLTIGLRVSYEDEDDGLDIGVCLPNSSLSLSPS